MVFGHQRFGGPKLSLPPSGPPTGPTWVPPPAGQPPPGPPPGAPPSAPPPEDERRRKGGAWWQSTAGLSIAGGIVAVAVIIAIVLVTMGKGNSTPASTSAGKEIFLDQASAVGRSPFTASVMNPTPAPAVTATPLTPATSPPGPGTGPPVITSTPATTPGLYGGTRQVATCDKQKLISFLGANPDKGRAWAQVEGITPDQIPAYVNGLTSVILRGDTRVTNHGFENGQATEYQSVLQAGTGVMVDRFGVPRVRCYCGNPLTPPIPVVPAYTGTPWPAFSPATVVVVQPAPQPITVIVIIDVIDGSTIARTMGASESKDTTAPPLGSPSAPPATATAAPTPSPTPSLCLIAPASAADRTCDVTNLGTAGASSTAPGDFAAANALDGNRATSWFSAGASEGDDSTFTWTSSVPVAVGSVSLLNNSQNSNPSFQHGYSFSSVTANLLNQGNVVATRDSAVDDQDVSVDFGGAVGTVLQLVLHHHLNPDCGGLAEVIVRGVRATG